jgi:hypothetical protein
VKGNAEQFTRTLLCSSLQVCVLCLCVVLIACRQSSVIHRRNIINLDFDCFSPTQRFDQTIRTGRLRVRVSSACLWYEICWAHAVPVPSLLHEVFAVWLSARRQKCGESFLCEDALLPAGASDQLHYGIRLPKMISVLW